VVAAGPASVAVTTEHVSAAFKIDVQYHDGRLLGRAARRCLQP